MGWLKRLAQDAVVILSAVSTLSAFTLWWWQVKAWQAAVQSGNAAAVDRVIDHLFRTPLALLLIMVLAVACLSSWPIWVWMVVDSVTCLAEDRRPVRVVWHLLVLAGWPAPLYYFAVYRRRARAAESWRRGGEHLET